MGLITCRDCNKEVSGRAAVCPGCGAPLKVRSGHSKVMRMVAMLSVFGLLYVGSQLLVGALEAYQSKEASPARGIVPCVMVCICFGSPAALYVWAVRKPELRQ
jgi:hypothetical protein